MTEAGEHVLFALVGLPPPLGFTQAPVRRVRLLLFFAPGLVYLGAHGGARRAPSPRS